VKDLNKPPLAKLVTGLAATTLGVALLYGACRGVFEYSPIYFKSAWVSAGQATITGVLLVIIGLYFLKAWWRERRSR
jgi:uncharacterized membrane protein